MKSGFDARQRAILAASLTDDRTPPCPACGGALARSPVGSRSDVSYVRRRILLVCGGCGRSAALDLPRTGDR